MHILMNPRLIHIHSVGRLVPRKPAAIARVLVLLIALFLQS